VVGINYFLSRVKGPRVAADSIRQQKKTRVRNFRL